MVKCGFLERKLPKLLCFRFTAEQRDALTHISLYHEEERRLIDSFMPGQEHPLQKTVSAEKIVQLQDFYTKHWHQQAPAAPEGLAGSWLQLVIKQHLANFELWHTEDSARIPGAPDSEIARTKRSIDKTNQLRNDLVEKCDVFLLEELGRYDLPRAEAELHSETPGLIIDRLSILSLKLFHTKEEIERIDAPPGHAERNRGRYDILAEQRKDLAGCLDRLWQQAIFGERRFKLYRQMKMYNDPTLNPQVYRTSTHG